LDTKTVLSASHGLIRRLLDCHPKWGSLLPTNEHDKRDQERNKGYTNAKSRDFILESRPRGWLIIGRVGISIGLIVDSRTLIIADNGPGISDHETAVLNRDKETDLQHGSGIGLWLVKWGTESFGGAVIFETDGTGTRVRITLPADLVEQKS